MRRVFYHQVVRLPSRTYTNHNPGPPSEPGYSFLREIPGAFRRFTITTVQEGVRGRTGCPPSIPLRSMRSLITGAAILQPQRRLDLIPFGSHQAKIEFVVVRAVSVDHVAQVP